MMEMLEIENLRTRWPIEFAVQAQKLLAVSLEGSVG
jgi:hypothetical protein